MQRGFLARSGKMSGPCVWFDIMNVSQVQFMYPFVKRFQAEFQVICTTRELAENVEFLTSLGIEFQVVGRHLGKRRIKKIMAILLRDLCLMRSLKPFDMSISCGSNSAFHLSKLRGKTSVSFDDNEHSLEAKPFYTRLVDYIIMPKAIRVEDYIDQETIGKKIIQYDGYKEDVYVADYAPDADFLKSIPFERFITIRPEALKAYYVKKEAKTIVPELFRLFSKENKNIVYFPRYPEDWEYARGYDNVFIPSKPLKGLDVCYYSDAVLTGSGTFGREAACLGTPAISFFPNERLIAVDQEMVEKGWSFHSRNPEEIIAYVLSSKKKQPDLDRSRRVQKEIFGILENIFSKVRNRRV
jgi:predicted glycosyltransferase